MVYAVNPISRGVMEETSRTRTTAIQGMAYILSQYLNNNGLKTALEASKGDFLNSSIGLGLLIRDKAEITAEGLEVVFDEISGIAGSKPSFVAPTIPFGLDEKPVKPEDLVEICGIIYSRMESTGIQRTFRQIYDCLANNFAGFTSAYAARNGRLDLVRSAQDKAIKQAQARARSSRPDEDPNFNKLEREAKRYFTSR